MRNKLGQFAKGNHVKTEFKKGHPKPKNAYVFPKGKKHWHWQGGRSKRADGYIYVYKPNHPFANPYNYVREHRLVMEKKLGRYLEPTEIVHHINGVRNDNRLKNLKLFTNNSKHKKFHIPKGSHFGINSTEQHS